MDIDPPTYTHIRRARTEQDKQRLSGQGKCFYCEKQGHFARDCPKKGRRQEPSQYRQRPSEYGQRPSSPYGGSPFKRKTYSQPKEGFRKFNRSRRAPFTPKARGAYIEETEETGNEEKRDDDVSSLAARTARLTEDQREQWVQEMNEMGINF
jgi:hypothetical protein